MIVLPTPGDIAAACALPSESAVARRSTSNASYTYDQNGDLTQQDRFDSYQHLAALQIVTLAAIKPIFGMGNLAGQYAVPRNVTYVT
jgi:3-deoxy-D-arabino-heptulosonate 7-phosphate (DAHP) synthase class II